MLHKYKDDKDDEEDDTIGSTTVSSPMTSPIYEDQPSTSCGNTEKVEFCDVSAITALNDSSDSESDISD